MFNLAKIMTVMNRYICILILVFVFFILGCNRDDINVFDGRSQIYFDKFYMNALAPGTEQADTTTASFFFYPEGTESIKVKLAVQFSGPALTSDLPFGLKVIEEASTAKPDEFKLEDSYTFRARPVPDGMKEVLDTIEVTLVHSDRLLELGPEGIRLVVELVPNDWVDLGQFERRRAVIVWTEVEAQPEWWDYEVEWALLGKYSYEKYKLFLQVVEGADELDGNLIKENPAKVINMVAQFKKWLTEHLDDPDNGMMYKEILDSLV